MSDPEMPGTNGDGDGGTMCSVCGQTFDTQEELAKHMSEVHGDQSGEGDMSGDDQPTGS